MFISLADRDLFCYSQVLMASDTWDNMKALCEGYNAYIASPRTASEIPLYASEIR